MWMDRRIMLNTHQSSFVCCSVCSCVRPEVFMFNSEKMPQRYQLSKYVHLVIYFLPPASEGWREVIFSVCSHLRGGGYPISGLGRGVPHPRSRFWGYPIPGPGSGGTPSQVWGVPHPRSGGTPSQVRGGSPSQVWGVPHPMSGGVLLVPPPE